jgi:hypothetical protein
LITYPDGIGQCGILKYIGRPAASMNGSPRQAPVKLPGAPFLLASALLLLALVIAARTLSIARTR